MRLYPKDMHGGRHFIFLYILFLVCTLCEVLLRSGNGFGLGYLLINVESLLKLFFADEF